MMLLKLKSDVVFSLLYCCVVSSLLAPTIYTMFVVVYQNENCVCLQIWPAGLTSLGGGRQAMWSWTSGHDGPSAASFSDILLDVA